MKLQETIESTGAHTRSLDGVANGNGTVVTAAGRGTVIVPPSARGKLRPFLPKIEVPVECDAENQISRDRE